MVVVEEVVVVVVQEVDQDRESVADPVHVNVGTVPVVTETY